MNRAFGPNRRHPSHTRVNISNLQRRPIAILGVAVWGLACIAGPAWGQLKVGEHYPAKIDTPRNYAGVTESEAGVTWHYELSHPGATYIAIHFADFDLGPGDYLLVSDPWGDQAYTLQGKGKMNAGTFWAQHVKGEAVTLQLVQISRQGGGGFLIDEYAAGYVDLDPLRGSRAICGTDDKENAVCYQTSHPTEYDHGRAVARLLIGGSGLCTGWLASANNLLITNEHCITSSWEALNTDYEFMSEAPTCSSTNCQLCWPGTVFSGGTLIQDDSNLDYALIEISSGDPAATYGYLEIDDRVPVIGEQIYIPQHPGGRAKEFAIYSTYPGDTGGVPRVRSITEPPCSGSGYYDVGYYADTEGGSSGSPVLATSSHMVIALHHCANCPNRGVPIHLIYPEISDFLMPGPAGIVSLDKGTYGCDDLVGIELEDGDLAGNAAQDVLATITGGDSETVTLLETGAGTAIFEGSISTGTGTATAEDGTLQVAHAQTITVTYIDADDGQGGTNVVVTAQALADCLPPMISNVQVTDVQPRTATITFNTDEPATGTIRFGLSCGSLNWSASGSEGQTAHTIDLLGLMDDVTYYFVVDAEDEAGNLATDDNGGVCYTFTTPDVPDYFTEQFDSENDLDDLSILFTPNGSVDFYEACVKTITELPTDPLGGTELSLGDDGYEAVFLADGQTVPLYGASYSSLYVGANGYLTFDSGDTDRSESLWDHFERPRVSALFDDLNPVMSGTVSYKQLDDRLAVTWQNVPEYYSVGSNTFQVEMFFDGRIRLNYQSIDAQDGLAGLSEGNGVPPNLYETNFTSLAPCPVLPCPGDLDGDGYRNTTDFTIFAGCYGWQLGDPNYLPDADMDGDGFINATDFTIFAGYYLVPCP